jgi:hypothetical protein
VSTPGRQRRVQCLLAIALLGCFGAPTAQASGEYRTVDVESLRITIDSQWAVRTAPGYLPVRFDITNLGEARDIEIIGQGSRYFRMVRSAAQGSISVRQAVHLARGDRVRLTLPVPVLADNENFRFEIRENGEALERFNHSGFQGRSPGDDASVLIVADGASAFGKMAASWPRPLTTIPGSYRVVPSGAGTVVLGRAASPMPPGVSGPELDFLLDPARLPTNWLGFTSLRAVVIGPMEWERLSDAQKSALLTWTACGGELMFVDGNPTALFPQGQHSAAVASDVASVPHFFGDIHFPTSASVETSGLEAALTAAHASAHDSNWMLPANRAPDWGLIAARGFRLPIPGVDGVPARAYLLILIVFALLIGPANYWFLWRRRRQVLLVLTAPLISVMFIVLLAGYVLAGEGVGVRARARTFTLLDQARKQAATRASISMYAAGMTPAGGLRFPRDMAVLPIGPDGTGNRERETLDLTDSQRFSSGVIQARSATNLEEIGFRPARERLSFSREGVGMSVVNGLGTTVARLIYRDGDQTYVLPEPLPQGGKTLLKTGTPDVRHVLPADGSVISRFESIVKSQPDGSYLAVLERSPFWDAGVAGVDERGSFHLVLGSLDGRP